MKERLTNLRDGQTGRVDVSGVRRVAVDVPGEDCGGEGDRGQTRCLDGVAHGVSEVQHFKSMNYLTSKLNAFSIGKYIKYHI